jgi:hypothetical protein
MLHHPPPGQCGGLTSSQKFRRSHGKVGILVIGAGQIEQDPGRNTHESLEVRFYVVLSTVEPCFQGGHKRVPAYLNETKGPGALLVNDRRTAGD